MDKTLKISCWVKKQHILLGQYNVTYAKYSSIHFTKKQIHMHQTHAIFIKHIRMIINGVVSIRRMKLRNKKNK